MRNTVGGRGPLLGGLSGFSVGTGFHMQAHRLAFGASEVKEGKSELGQRPTFTPQEPGRTKAESRLPPQAPEQPLHPQTGLSKSHVGSVTNLVVRLQLLTGLSRRWLSVFMDVTGRSGLRTESSAATGSPQSRAFLFHRMR